MTGNQNENGETHEYDGIIEHDNPLPRWWLATFYLSVVFAILYSGYYLFGSGKSLVQEFQDQQKQIQINVASQSSEKGPTNASESELNTALASSESKANGKSVFEIKCASCHGPNGQGTIGPNLTDKFWIHGGKITDIINVITNGVLDKGMPPWGTLLTKDELVNVTAYVKSLKGSNPTNPKASQGTESND